MSKQDKKEITTYTSGSSSTTRDDLDQAVQNNNQIFNRVVEETTQSLNQVFEESKKSIERNINEAKNQIPIYTKTINEVQEQAVQATRDIAENYLDYQKQAIDSFQSVVTPYIENVNNQLWNNQDIFRRIPEIYSKMANNYAENSVALSRLINNIAFSNVDIVKSVINNTKEQSKQFAEIGKRNARVYESVERDNRNSL
jgi:hypothetical protein